MHSIKNELVAAFLRSFKDPYFNKTHYIHAVNSEAELHEDFALCLLELLTPTFRIVEGYLYLEVTFNQPRYEAETRRLRSLAEVQYWLNLLEITYVFENMSEKNALQFAHRLVATWNLKIEAEHPTALGRAHVLHEDEDGEVYVVIKTSEM